MNFFAKIIFFFALLAITILSTGFAVVITAFAGSGNNPPTWYFFYLGLTQGIPIVVYAMSFILIAFCILLEKKVNTKISSALGISFAVYILSFFGLIIIGAINK
ncbi:hypothetical protein [Methylotenera sp. G11]|uniref:hypothetical protein n=1 Tax=Methylotenera sp. G11 TaxID=1506585 RepID=UPI000645AD0D|nr:hypothetical protein [Methylotenera sp. G11]